MYVVLQKLQKNKSLRKTKKRTRLGGDLSATDREARRGLASRYEGRACEIMKATPREPHRASSPVGRTIVKMAARSFLTDRRGAAWSIRRYPLLRITRGRF